MLSNDLLLDPASNCLDPEDLALRVVDVSIGAKCGKNGLSIEGVDGADMFGDDAAESLVLERLLILMRPKGRRSLP
ncbi:MAG: hypothetical protein WDM77_16520 [Steroidobacteraceae bacterium]